MIISVNGNNHDIPESTSVTDLLTQLDYDGGTVAVAINTTFVPRQQQLTTTLQPGDCIDIVAPMQGG